MHFYLHLVGNYPLTHVVSSGLGPTEEWAALGCPASWIGTQGRNCPLRLEGSQLARSTHLLDSRGYVRFGYRGEFQGLA